MFLLHTTYFGAVDWYAAVLRHGGAAISTSDVYQRQTERNRCRIATANGVQTLTVPVTLPETARGGRCLIREVRISDHGNWRHLHWNAIASAYGMSPFFDYYADDLRPFFEKKWEFLYDYNMEIAQTMLRLLGAEVQLTESPVSTLSPSALSERGESCGGVSCIYAYPSGEEGKGARGESEATYYQTFQRRHGFLPGMSIVDLLCNEGPEGIMKL